MNAFVTFGPYRLDRAGGRLLRGKASVRLRRKTFAVFEYLALHRGRLVPKDELLDAVWPGVVVTPSVLAGCIRELRRALGDDARAPRFVETAHRRGYRFVGRSAPASRASRTPTREAELALLARSFARAVARLAVRRRPPPRRVSRARSFKGGKR